MGSSEAGATAATTAEAAGGAAVARGCDEPEDRDVAGDRGFVTAEAAVVLPVLVAFTMALVWALLAAAALIQCVDAARAGARAAARQEPPGTVTEIARQAAPGGARVTVRREGDLVHVRVEAGTPGPDALALDLTQEATALAEETVGTPR